MSGSRSLVRKAVFPCAGLGTRFLPATKAQPKEMLPIYDRPAIQYVVEEAIASHLNDLVIVTGRGKQAIENHFDKSFELEHYLRQRGNRHVLEQVEQISDLADIHYVRQKEPLGLGHAIWCARSFVGAEPFAVFLADDIVYSRMPAMAQLLKVYEKVHAPVIAVEKVARVDLSSYGVIDPVPIPWKGEEKAQVFQIRDVVEKPSPQAAPSRLGILGRYVLTPEIFRELEVTKRGKLGEIQLTDAIKGLLKKGHPFYAVLIEGIRYDVGTHVGFMRCAIEYALRSKSTGPALSRYLHALTNDRKRGQGGKRGR